MNKRGTGLGLLLIASLLFSARYIAAAIYGSNTTSWDAKLFDAMLQYVGNELLIASIIFFVFGIVYLFVAEVKK